MVQDEIAASEGAQRIVRHKLGETGKPETTGDVVKDGVGHAPADPSRPPRPRSRHGGSPGAIRMSTLT